MPSKFDKYKYYTESVQSPEDDVVFFDETYESFYKKKAKTFREDFCGTFLIGIEWAKLRPKNQSIVVDLSKEPLNYGKKNFLSKLDPKDQKRVTICQDSVLSKKLPKADIITASNFSYFIFKEEEMLIKYFKNVRSQLNKQGLFVMDIFGGSQCYEPNEEITEYDGFDYYWDQDSFDPITNEGMFYIHFKVGREKKREKVFTYDWRVWSIPEIKYLLKQAGFSSTDVYWEESDKDGNGNGEFKKAKKGEDCETWLAYLVSRP